MYYRQAVAALVVYDITNHTSYEITHQWINEVIERVGSVVIALVGNKSDMANSRTVPSEEPEEFVKSLKEKGIPAFFIECSAKSGENIQEVFKGVGTRLIESAGLES